MLSPYIRKYNYISDYFYTVYDMYIRVNKAFPVTYYSTDLENSILDDENSNVLEGGAGLLGGTYEKDGIGELSGKLFKKISMLPVHNMQTIQPTLETGDKGYHAGESLTATFDFPDVYGLKPLSGDVLNLNYGMNIDGKPDNRILYQVTNVNMSHFGQYLNVWQIQCRVAPFFIDDIEKQLSKFLAFNESTKTIIPTANANLLNNILKRSEKISYDLNTVFNKVVSLYFEKNYFINND